MEPPSFSTNCPQIVRAGPGSDASIVLPLPSGSPPFHYEWSRAGAKLDDRFKPANDSGGVRLTISSARTGDSDVYTLQASNAAGKDTTRVRLEVSPDEKSTGEDPPKFLRRLQDLTVKVGTRTRFLVEIVSSTECRVTWYRNERRLLEAERIALVRDGNFWCADISAVSVDDAGRWTCTAENVGGRASCSAHLNVLVPKAYKRPEFVEELRALLTEQGTVSLECKVVGVPTPVLRWFKDSREIKAGDVFALTANAEDPTSLGTYTCEAVNCMGRAYSSSKVHVIGRASREGSVRPSSGGVALEPPPIFTKELEDQFVRICEPLTLSCKIVVPPWPRGIVWYNKEGKIEPSDRYRVLEDGVGGYLLEVPSAEWPDEGEWKCVATSSGGRVGITTCYVSMDVPKNYRKPRFMENLQAVLTEEGLVSFECKVVGFPTPVLSWFKDGQELKPGDVYQLTGTNSLGSYCCIARNCMGHASSSAELTVEDIQNQLNEEEKLQLFSKNQAPKFLQGLKSVEAKIDEPFRFTIKVAIPPEPTVLWYRDEQPVDESSRCHHGKEERGVFFLDIQSLEFMDQAEWKCVAMNDFGHSVTSCFLKLIIPRHYKKPRFLENLQAILSDEGAVNLECKVIGVPQPVLKWYKDGEELKPGDIHRIISGQDGTCCLGTYTCEAQNCMGIAASSASLLGFEDSIKAKSKTKVDEQTLQRNLSLSTIHEERTSQMYDTPVGDITLDDKGEISFSFDGKEVSVSLYETPDLTEEEALQIVEMYADQLSENITEHNVIELPPLRFVKETSTSGNLLMEAIIIDVSPDYFTSPDEDLRTEADIEDISIADENGPPQLSLDQEINGEDYLEKTMALLSDDKADFPKKTDRKKSDSQRSAEDYFSLSQDQSLSEEKKDDDTHVLSESDLQSFASARSSGKPKSKSSKPSIEDGQESSDKTKTVLLKEDLLSRRQEIDSILIKSKQERRNSRKSSSGSEKSLNKIREEVFDNALNKTILDQERTKIEINCIGSSLSKIINSVQKIERDIILKSELMSTAATASQSLEIINSLINPLSEILSITDTIKETITESLEVTASLFNRLPQTLNVLHQSLIIIQKCIDIESDNKTLVKKTCTNITDKCGEEINKLMKEICSLVNSNCSFLENTSASNILTTTNEIFNTIVCSLEAIKESKNVTDKIDAKLDKRTPELKHLQKTQKAVYELRNPLKSLLNIAEEVDISSFKSIDISDSQIILNDMSTPIQDLQNALEQIEFLSMIEAQSNLEKYNTEIIETVMESVIKLRTSFEQLSAEARKMEKTEELSEVMAEIKHNIKEISSHIDIFEAKIGLLDILDNENKLEVLQKMAQILINLENNLVVLDMMPYLKTHMTDFHKNLTKVLEHVIESNDARKYFTLLEICDVVNRVNTLLKNMDSNDLISFDGVSKNLKTIQANVQINNFTPELNYSILTNLTDLLDCIDETVHYADTSTFSVVSENVEALSIRNIDEGKLNILLEQIEKAVITMTNVTTLESTNDLVLKQTIDTIVPTLAEIKCCVASLNVNVTEDEENVSNMSNFSFMQTAAHALCELNVGLSVLNQVICEKVASCQENEALKMELAIPLFELRNALEILQQDVISQNVDNENYVNISNTVAHAVQSIQSCILVIQEQDLQEIADEMSTLDDISALKTSVDILTSDYFMSPIAQETITKLDTQSMQSVAALTLNILNNHISKLQSPEVMETLDTMSEHYEYSKIKSIITGLEEIHYAIEGILHPITFVEVQNLPTFLSSTKLATIIQPLQDLHNSLSVIDMSKLLGESESQVDKINVILQNVSKLDNCVSDSLNSLCNAIEIADLTLEIATNVDTLQKLCEKFKTNLQLCINDEDYECAELIVLDDTLKEVLDATSYPREINIAQVKSATENLHHIIIMVRDEILGFALQKPVIENETMILKSIDDIEKNITNLEQLRFVDKYQVLELDSYVFPQLSKEIDFEILNKIENVIEKSTNFTQVVSLDAPNSSLVVPQDFFKIFKNEIILLRYLITNQQRSPKQMIKMLQVFYDLCINFKQFQLSQPNTYITEELDKWLVDSEECLKQFQTLLVEVLSSHSHLILDDPISNIKCGEIILNNIIESGEYTQLHHFAKLLWDVVKTIKPLFENIQADVFKELELYNFNTDLDNDLIKHFDLLINCVSDKISAKEGKNKETFEAIYKVIQKHADCKLAIGTGQKIIFIKCISDCLNILRHTCKESQKAVLNEESPSNGYGLKELLIELSEPIENLNNKLISTCNENLSKLNILEEMKSIKTHLETITEIKKKIDKCIPFERSCENEYTITLANKLVNQISSIQKCIKYLETITECASIQPLVEIQRILTILLAQKAAQEENRQLKEKTDLLLQHMEHYIEIIEIVEEVSAVIQLDKLKNSADMVREFQESINTSSDISFGGSEVINCAAQIQLVQNLQKALTSLQIQVFDSEQELAPSNSDDIRHLITEVVSDLQNNLLALTSTDMVLENTETLENDDLINKYPEDHIQYNQITIQDAKYITEAEVEPKPQKQNFDECEKVTQYAVINLEALQKETVNVMSQPNFTQEAPTIVEVSNKEICDLDKDLQNNHDIQKLLLPNFDAELLNTEIVDDSARIIDIAAEDVTEDNKDLVEETCKETLKTTTDNEDEINICNENISLSDVPVGIISVVHKTVTEEDAIENFVEQRPNGNERVSQESVPRIIHEENVGIDKFSDSKVDMNVLMEENVMSSTGKAISLQDEHCPIEAHTIVESYSLTDNNYKRFPMDEGINMNEETPNAIYQLETLLQEVNEALDLSLNYPLLQNSEQLQDTLEEIQTVIIKLKYDFDGSTNDILNENFEDLECNVRSIQLQINEQSPPMLLKEACANLQILVISMSDIYNTQTNSSVIVPNNAVYSCTNDTEKAIELLDNVICLKVDSHLDKIVSYLNSIKDTMKFLKSSFSDNSDSLIIGGIEILQNLDYVEDKVFTLERELNADKNIDAVFRDSIIAATHSIYGSISNMRGAICSIQKKYMYDNYGRPSHNFLKSIKNLNLILNHDNKSDWKQFAKTLRKVLNHFEDVKFYINFDKTARLPSDAAFTKIILCDLKTALFEIVSQNVYMGKTVTELVKEAIDCVDKHLSNIENMATLEVKEKIPVFKELSTKMLELTDGIKTFIEKNINEQPVVETFLEKEKKQLDNKENLTPSNVEHSNEDKRENSEDCLDREVKDIPKGGEGIVDSEKEITVLDLICPDQNNFVESDVVIKEIDKEKDILDYLEQQSTAIHNADFDVKLTCTTIENKEDAEILQSYEEESLAHDNAQWKEEADKETRKHDKTEHQNLAEEIKYFSEDTDIDLMNESNDISNISEKQMCTSEMDKNIVVENNVQNIVIENEFKEVEDNNLTQESILVKTEKQDATFETVIMHEKSKQDCLVDEIASYTHVFLDDNSNLEKPKQELKEVQETFELNTVELMAREEPVTDKMVQLEDVSKQQMNKKMSDHQEDFTFLQSNLTINDIETELMNTEDAQTVNEENRLSKAEKSDVLSAENSQNEIVTQQQNNHNGKLVETLLLHSEQKENNETTTLVHDSNIKHTEAETLDQEKENVSTIGSLALENAHDNNEQKLEETKVFQINNNNPNLKNTNEVSESSKIFKIEVHLKDVKTENYEVLTDEIKAISGEEDHTQDILQGESFDGLEINKHIILENVRTKSETVLNVEFDNKGKDDIAKETEQADVRAKQGEVLMSLDIVKSADLLENTVTDLSLSQQNIGVEEETKETEASKLNKEIVYKKQEPEEVSEKSHWNDITGNKEISTTQDEKTKNEKYVGQEEKTNDTVSPEQKVKKILEVQEQEKKEEISGNEETSKVQDEILYIKSAQDVIKEKEIKENISSKQKKDCDREVGQQDNTSGKFGSQEAVTENKETSNVQNETTQTNSNSHLSVDKDNKEIAAVNQLNENVREQQNHEMISEKTEMKKENMNNKEISNVQDETSPTISEHLETKEEESKRVVAFKQDEHNVYKQNVQEEISEKSEEKEKFSGNKNASNEQVKTPSITREEHDNQKDQIKDITSEQKEENIPGVEELEKCSQESECQEDTSEKKEILIVQENVFERSKNEQISENKEVLNVQDKLLQSKSDKWESKKEEPKEIAVVCKRNDNEQKEQKKDSGKIEENEDINKNKETLNVQDETFQTKSVQHETTGEELTTIDTSKQEEHNVYKEQDQHQISIKTEEKGEITETTETSNKQFETPQSKSEIYASEEEESKEIAAVRKVNENVPEQQKHETVSEKIETKEGINKNKETLNVQDETFATKSVLHETKEEENTKIVTSKQEDHNVYKEDEQQQISKKTEEKGETTENTESSNIQFETPQTKSEIYASKEEESKEIAAVRKVNENVPEQQKHEMVSEKIEKKEDINKNKETLNVQDETFPTKSIQHETTGDEPTTIDTSKEEPQNIYKEQDQQQISIKLEEKGEITETTEASNKQFENPQAKSEIYANEDQESKEIGAVRKVNENVPEQQKVSENIEKKEEINEIKEMSDGLDETSQTKNEANEKETKNMFASKQDKHNVCKEKEQGEVLEKIKEKEEISENTETSNEQLETPQITQEKSDSQKEQTEEIADFEQKYENIPGVEPLDIHSTKRKRKEDNSESKVMLNVNVDETALTTKEKHESSEKASKEKKEMVREKQEQEKYTNRSESKQQISKNKEISNVQYERAQINSEQDECDENKTKEIHDVKANEVKEIVTSKQKKENVCEEQEPNELFSNESEKDIEHKEISSTQVSETKRENYVGNDKEIKAMFIPKQEHKSALTQKEYTEVSQTTENKETTTSDENVKNSTTRENHENHEMETKENVALKQKKEYVCLEKEQEEISEKNKNREEINQNKENSISERIETLPNKDKREELKKQEDIRMQSHVKPQSSEMKAANGAKTEKKEEYKLIDNETVKIEVRNKSKVPEPEIKLEVKFLGPAQKSNNKWEDQVVVQLKGNLPEEISQENSDQTKESDSIQKKQDNETYTDNSEEIEVANIYQDNIKQTKNYNESHVFTNRNELDYELEFLRPTGYNAKTFDIEDSAMQTKICSKIPTIYKAQSLLHESQLRSSVLPYLDQRPNITEGRSDLKQRSKTTSESRSTISERRTGLPRDVKRKPVFSTNLTDRTAVEGSRVKLTCSILSSTNPIISWYKNGILIDNKQICKTKYIDGLITLEILNAIPSDSGEYSCTVENENGSVSSSANLKVYPSFEASPIPPTFTRTIRDTYHLLENELVLECRIRGQPLPTISWLKDNKPITLNERYQAHYLADGVCRLTIMSPSENDSGKYTCKAENSMWSDQITHAVYFNRKESIRVPNIITSENLLINRQATEFRRPHFTNVLSDHKVVSGGTIGLQVEISGSPTRVEWLREGRSIIETYRNAKTYVDHGLYTLALSDVTEKESGLYTCRAWNTHGTVDMNASIIVVQQTQFDGKPATIISRPVKDLLISVGEDLNISFRVQGEPKPKVFFMKGIRDITNSQRVCKMTSDDYVKFTLKRSVVSDAGTYCVFARNAYGCDRAFVTVVIRQRASSDNLISDWTYPMDDLAISVVDRNYKSVPDRIPSEPSAVDGGNNWVSLAWPKPDTQAKAPILAYKMESWLLGKEGGARWTELGITPRNSFDAFNLKQGEEYHFRVTPRNRYGWGESVQTSTPIGIGLAGNRPEFIEILPGQLKVLVGEKTNLCCSFKGKPMPEIVWLKNGHEVEEETERVKVELSGNNTSLRINDVKIEDEGRYSCEATNIHGRSSTYSRVAIITDKTIWAADAKLKRERSAGANGEYPPQFTMRLRDRRVQATYPVRLTCQVIGNPTPTVTWLKNGDEVSADSRHTMSQDEYFYTLEIAPTTLDDGGIYEAMARNGCGAISCRCNLVVDKGIRAYIAPEFCCGFEPLYRVFEGDELRISAVVEAYPSVGVTWYRDGVRLRPSRRAVMTLDRDGQIELALASVAIRDAGVYMCTASNEVGRASTSGKVEIIKGENETEMPKVPPIVISSDLPYSKEPMFIRKPRSSEACEGDTVIIECEVIGDPKPDVYWLRDFLKPDYYRDGNHFKRVGAGPEYRFEIPHAKFDYTGAYSIVAKNIHGEAKAIISLQILAKDLTSSDDTHSIRYGRVEIIPRFEKELTDLLCYDGDAIEFECRVSGNPDPDIRWFHYNEVLPECADFETSYDLGTARLKIKQLTAEDEGTYTCEASNNLGKATSSACLVIYPPGEPNTLSQRLRRPPALLSASSTPRSTPRTTPARSLSRTPGPELRRLCSPSREIAPKFYTYPYNRVVEEGDTIVFQCAVRGLPPPWATWDKDGIVITPTARISIREKDDMYRILEIEEVTIEDVGLYRVTLENDYGRAEASARLEVISQTGKFYGSRSYSISPRKCLPYRRRTPSLTRQD